MRTELTKLSSKGQVVIPKNIRNELKLEDGTPFLIVVNDETICLKRINMPNSKEWDRITRGFKEAARKSGFSQEDLFNLLGETRKKR